MLQGKKILLGVCGSIAAYKSPLLVRLLIKAGAEIQVVQTSASKDFVTPTTLSTLSKNPALSEFTNNDDSGEWNNHVDLGLWADLLVVAPASANTLAKMANGICDNLLTAVYLSARCPVMIAPAMDLDMYQHPASQANLETLRTFGNQIIEAKHGELASGLVGVGRMAEPEEVLEAIEAHFKSTKALEGKKVLMTCGPTEEAIDPVRFISNQSTGKMGFSIAEEAANQGAEVTVVSGPTHQVAAPDISVIQVKSAEQMFLATQEHFPKADIAIFTAAVSDYRPAEIAPQKIKKHDPELIIRMIKNKDIAAEIGKTKAPNQITVGFALETENEEQNAQKKLKSKNLDMIVLNSLNDNGAGFSHDTNKITIFDKYNNRSDFELKSKKEVAKDIINTLADLIGK